MLAFRVNDAAVQRLLPSGWTTAPSPAAEATGAPPLRLVFVNRQLALDGRGKVYRAGTSRYIVFAVPARNAAARSTP